MSTVLLEPCTQVENMDKENVGTIKCVHLIVPIAVSKKKEKKTLTVWRVLQKR